MRGKKREPALKFSDRLGAVDSGSESNPPVGSRWTPAQWRGIAATGQSVLVSAAAGSGKTSVLAERCVYLVCDAPNPCDIDELLVVTFTEAAAATMKQRITAALRERMMREPSARLARQVALAEQAQVGTLHGFCLRLLRQYFHRARLDPTFRVLDADEAKLMRRELARELFQNSYELDNDGSFHRLIDAYGDGDDHRVIRQVLHAHDLLTSVQEPQAWMNNARERIAEAAEGEFQSSRLGEELLEIVKDGLEALIARCQEARREVASLGFAKYVGYIDSLRGTLDYWMQALRGDGLDALSEVAGDVDWKQLKLPPEAGDPADRAVAKALIDSVRESMKEGAWRNLLRFTCDGWQEGLQAILPHATAFLDLVDRFGKIYSAAKSSARVVDFADLERLALQVLREEGQLELTPSDVARSYHKRFAHVLVDEYQDINQVQDALLRLVSRECLASEVCASNLFCVGDVKQSIYRFRLAEPRQFLEKEQAFRNHEAPGQVIDLHEN